MDALLARKRELSAALAVNTRERKRARAQSRGAALAVARAWALPDQMRHSVLIAYVHADYEFAPATKLLAARGRQLHWPVKSEEDLVRIVEDLFLEVDDVQLAALTDLEDPLDAAAAHDAVRYVAEWRLAEWTAQLNMKKGVAPSTDALLQQFEAQRLALPESMRPAARGTSAEASARVWISAWRKRWGARYGRVKIRENVSVDDMRQKASFQSRVSPPRCLFSGTHGSIFRSPIRDRISVLFRDRFLVPLFDFKAQAAGRSPNRDRYSVLI